MKQSKNDVYQNSFENWNDVVYQFCGVGWNSEKDKQEALNNHPEPSEVLYANYDESSYHGHAVVIWRDGRKYYFLEGSHCSYYGLEDTGEPEEFSSKAIFVAFLKKLRRVGTFSDEERDALVKKLESR